jgi:hypothetical protein
LHSIILYNHRQSLVIRQTLSDFLALKNIFRLSKFFDKDWVNIKTLKTSISAKKKPAMSKNDNVLPRLIRLRDAAHYLGMDRHRFDKEVRPFLTEIPIGIQGKAFDRLDLDKWVDYYKERSGRPSKKRLELWGVKERQDSTNVETTGTLTRKSSDDAFAKVLEQILSKKRKSTSRGEPKN